MRACLIHAGTVAWVWCLFALPSNAQPRPLILLGDIDYAPLSYQEHGQPKGMDVDVARAVAAAAGREVRIELMDWQTAQDKVLRGEADGLLSMSITEERKKLYDFTDPIMEHDFGILVRSDDLTIHGINDLAGKVVAVTPGGFPRTFLMAKPDVRLILVESSQKGLEHLAAGSIDAVAVDLWVAAYAIQKRQLRQITVAGDTFATRQAGIAVRKGDTEALQTFRRAVAKVRSEGTIERIQAQWRPQEMVYFSLQSVHRLAILGACILLLILVGAMAVWVRMLKRQIRYRKAVEADLVESKERLDVALSAAHMGTWRWCAATREVTRDANLSRMLGLEPVEATYQVEDMFQRLHPEDVEKTRAKMEQTLDSRGPFALEYRVVRPDGAVRWFRLQGRPFYDGAGALNYISGAIVDVTELKDAEKERRRLEEQLRQAQKMETVGRLAGGIAHDFNNLLTVINGYSALLASRSEPGDQIHRQATEIGKAGERAAVLTQQLLAFSHRQVAQAQPVHLSQVAAETLRAAAGRMPPGIELRSEFRAEPDWVVADPSQIHTVLTNLIANAREAMPGGGLLRIETSNADVKTPDFLYGIEVEPGPYVRLSVLDNGAGIGAETMAHIFEPFFTTKEEGKGVGLGLSTVYGIVRQSGGFVSVASQPGEGAAFHIYLPLSAAEPASIVPAPAKRVQPTALAGTETILVVEDEDNVRELAMETLRSYGYTVMGAADGNEALQIAWERPDPIHLLLTDVVMPGMNGRVLADQLRPVRPDTRVVFMSGYSDDLISRHGVLETGLAYIPKPFAGEELAAKVREVLDASDIRSTILVADDEDAVRSLLEELLVASGHNVLLASDGIQVFDVLREHSDVDLVITDLVMPRQEGIETVQAIRQQYPAIKVVAMSGAFGGRLLKTVKLLGAHATLSKPIQPEALRQTVDDLLGKGR